jgi:hypothetical protein
MKWLVLHGCEPETIKAFLNLDKTILDGSYAYEAANKCMKKREGERREREREEKEGERRERGRGERGTERGERDRGIEGQRKRVEESRRDC